MKIVWEKFFPLTSKKKNELKKQISVTIGAMENELSKKNALK